MSADRRPTTVSALWRLLPYARPALPRLILGMVVGISAGLVALAIPQVLEYLVDTVLADRNAAGILPAALARSSGSASSRPPRSSCAAPSC